MYTTKLLNKFCEALFSTDFNDYSTETQNMKTDCLSEVKDYDSWVDKLVDTFVKEFEVDKEQLLTDLKKDPNFLDDLRDEYEELVNGEDIW
jgi:predicted nuclease with TOPRIM domain